MAHYDPFASSFDHPLINSSPDFSSRNGTFSNRPVGGLQSSSLAGVLPSFGSQQPLRDRLTIWKELDAERHLLLNDLLYQLETTQEQLRKTRLEQQASNCLDYEDRNAFVMVLIDGDGTVFNKELLSKGEAGGKEAANRLVLAASDLIAQRLAHLQSPKLVLRIYADLAALSDLLVRSQIIESPLTLDDFIRGFNSSEALFDFVDTGNRPGATADKVCQLLKLNLYDCHCHQVIFAPSHSREYGVALQEVLGDSQVVSHLTLVESVPFDKELEHVQSQFHSARFDSIFCKSRPSGLAAIAPPKPASAVLPALTKVESNKTTANSSASSTPAPNWATITAAIPPAPPGLKALANGSTTSVNSSKAGSKVAGKPGKPRTIQTNRFGQRIDDTDSTIPNYEIQRVKKLKLCNLYYLQGKDMCPSSSCTHRHDYPISNSERRTLREVARMTPCYFRTECENPDCIYGHQCPQNKPNEPDCYFKEDCRYHGWGHGIDTRVVKTTKI
ncbi:hypothetical protein DV738_g4421, partial [Chaetothyriales sp. CBS 135597]